MLRFLWRLFVVGFPPKKPDCDHEFGSWETFKTWADTQWGEYIVIQTRICKKCGAAELRKVET